MGTYYIIALLLGFFQTNQVTESDKVNDGIGVIFFILLCAALIILAFILFGIRQVSQAEAMVIERLGKYNRTLRPGLRIIWPFFEKAREIMVRYTEVMPDGTPVSKTIWKKKIDLRDRSYDFPKQPAITRDNVMIQIDAIVIYQIIDPERAIYGIANLPVAMEQLTQTTLRNVIGEMDLDETFVSREIINDKIKTALDQATGRWGVLVNRVEIKDIKPSDEIVEAMEKQMRAERDKRAAILEAEGKKEAAILEAEGTKESQIHYADGEKRANIMQAEGEAVARIRGAQAEAEALNKIAAIISPDKGDPANYLIAVRYIEALKEMVSGKENKVVYLPYEATGILGAIGGMKDMLESMKRQKESDTRNSTDTSAP